MVKKWNASGSLSRRILIVSILLLVVPFGLQALFLYWQEYREKVADTKEELEVLAKERVHLIEEMIQIRWAILDAQPEYDPCTDPPLRDPICGGNELDVKPLYIRKIPDPQGVEDYFVIVNKSKTGLLIGKREGFTASALFVPLSQIGADLGLRGDIEVSLLGSGGEVIEQRGKLSEGAERLTVVEPIANTNFSLQLSVDEASLRGLHFVDYLFRFFLLLFFIGFVGGTAVYFFTRRIQKPLKDLCKTMERVSEGAQHVRYKPDRMGFEINQLGLQFNETMDLLQSHAQEAEKERIRREKLAEELRIGHEIQANLVPSRLPGFEGLEIGTGYLASKEVNGDFYDLFKMKDGKLLMVVSDTAGKGVPACLYSLGLRSIFRSLSSITSDLSEIVLKANDLYYLDAHESSMFSTAWVGIYDPESRQLSYCSLGHPPALLRRKNQIRELWTDGIALGAQKLDLIPTKTLSLETGDLLVLYTDGILEAHDPDQHLFGKKRLHEFILRKKREHPQQMGDQLIDEIHLFAQGTPQHDDMTLVILHLT
jgi:serine phosphatase RsbU (regulator of sigma subunit)